MALTPAQRRLRDNPDPMRMYPNRVRKRIRDVIVALDGLPAGQQAAAYWRLDGDQLARRTRPTHPPAPPAEPEL